MSTQLPVSLISYESGNLFYDKMCQSTFALKIRLYIILYTSTYQAFFVFHLIFKCLLTNKLLLTENGKAFNSYDVHGIYIYHVL